MPYILEQSRGVAHLGIEALSLAEVRTSAVDPYATNAYPFVIVVDNLLCSSFDLIELFEFMGRR